MIKFICSFFNSKISPPDPLIIFIYLITWTTIGAQASCLHLKAGSDPFHAEIYPSRQFASLGFAGSAGILPAFKSWERRHPACI
jgi:hypothetical protein